MQEKQKFMNIMFCRSKTPLSWLIRKLTWSEWSHVVLIDGDYGIEAVGTGVTYRHLATIKAGHSETQIRRIACPCPFVGIQAAFRQIGKRYDWKALAGQLFHRDWQQTDKWFCSELVAWALTQSGNPIFNAASISRVTPQMLWMVSEAPE